MILKKIFSTFLILNITFTGLAHSFTLDELNQQKSIFRKNIPAQNNFFLKNNTKFENTGSEYVSDSFEPLNNYILASGDTISFNLESQDINIEYEITISPEGKIFIPKIGEFLAFNLTTKQLKEVISNKISKKLKKFENLSFIKKNSFNKNFYYGICCKTRNLQYSKWNQIV